MNFNVYLDDESVRRLDALARKEKVARNALVRRAVLSLLDGSSGAWPKAVLDFAGEPGVEPFETHRAELAAVPDDPFDKPAFSGRRRASSTKRSKAVKRR